MIQPDAHVWGCIDIGFLSLPCRTLPFINFIQGSFYFPYKLPSYSAIVTVIFFIINFRLFLGGGVAIMKHIITTNVYNLF